MKELIERSRGIEGRSEPLVGELADALEAADKRIAELTAERDCWKDTVDLLQKQDEGAIAELRSELDAVEAERDALKKDEQCIQQIRLLVDGGHFDLTDSPKSFISAVVRMVSFDAAKQSEGE